MLITEYRKLRDRAIKLTTSTVFKEKVGELRQLRALMATSLECMQVTPDQMRRAGELAVELDPLLYVQCTVDVMDGMLDYLDEFPEDLNDLKNMVDRLEFRAMMQAPNSKRSATVTIHSRDGGTEACDWASMLAAMYSKWAADRGYLVSILSQHFGTEAGISSMSIEISGAYVYGYLAGEEGLHRLIRISPFNAQGKRQTSFAAVQVDPIVPATRSVINESDLEWDYFRAPGPGGQHKNKTESAVRLTHVPSGITVTCVTDRSQTTNKEGARMLLTARLAKLQSEKEAAKKAAKRGEQPVVGFGSQIRSYFRHPQQRVVDARTGHRSGNFQAVLGGEIQPFLEAFLTNKDH